MLKEKVKTLEQRCRVLAVENETLKAEVEMYRRDFASSSAASGGAGDGSSGAGSTTETIVKDHFVQSGSGVFSQVNEVALEKLHGISNPSCCSLNNNDTVLATGGADQNVTLCQWGASMNGGQDAVEKTAFRISCGAPVISIDFARKSSRSPFVAAACMDGAVHIIHYEVSHNGLEAKEVCAGTIKHTRYIRTVVWASNDNIVATGSADGSVQVHKVIWNGLDDNFQLEKIQALNFSAPVESLCFHKEKLVCYVRDTPHLSYFDMNKDFEQTKVNLNQGPGNAGFDDHVSFAVMDMSAHGNYLALATDTSRNIIIEFDSGKQVRNLYGHKNDGFSQPKIAWSCNGQYLYGNTQDESTVCVWDVATSEIITRLDGHTNPIRDMFSSTLTDTLVTTSFDKKTIVWLPKAS